MDLFFDSNMLNHLLKTNGRRDRRFKFVIFLVWSALIVNSWLAVNSLASGWLNPIFDVPGFV